MAQRLTASYDFEANAGHSIRALRLSPKWLASAGEDRRVHLYSMESLLEKQQEPQPHITLTGHVSAVTSFAFDVTGDMAVGGGQNGSLRIWDLHQSKSTRTLTGHRQAITALEWHTYGEFFASGAADCTMRLWDQRRQGCVHTYTGHAGAIQTVRVSPDGRWVVSAAVDGEARLWDLTAGKLLQTFTTGVPLVSCAFHPREFLLLTLSQEGTCHTWDLASMKTEAIQVFETSRDAYAMTLEDSGRYAYITTAQGLFIISLQQQRVLDRISLTGAAPNHVDDMIMSQEHEYVLMAGRDGSIARIFRFHADATPPASQSHTPQKTSTPKSKTPPRVVHFDEKQESVPSDATNQASKEVERGHLPELGPTVTKSMQVINNNNITPTHSPALSRPALHVPAAVAAVKAAELAKQGSKENVTLPAKESIQNKPLTSSFQRRQPKILLERCGERPLGLTGSLFQSFYEQSDEERESRQVLSALITSCDANLMTAGEDSNWFSSLESQHKSLCPLLAQRLGHLRALRRVWQPSLPLSLDDLSESLFAAERYASAAAHYDAQGLVESLVALQEDSVLCDVLKNVLLRSSQETHWTLSMAVTIWPALMKITRASVWSDHVGVALQTCTHLMRQFGSLMRDTLTQQVDISHEERWQRCHEWHQGVEQLYQYVMQEAQWVRPSDAAGGSGIKTTPNTITTATQRAIEFVRACRLVSLPLQSS